MFKNPYLRVVSQTREMEGTGAPRATVFGVLGHTIESSDMKSLGGIIVNTTANPSSPYVMVASGVKHNTEHDIIGPKSKSAYAPSNYGHIPYPGKYNTRAGRLLR